MTGVGEFDRILGGGLVAGQVVLVAGEPGVGKSTLLLDVARSFSESGRRTLYVSGEESAEQIALRAARIGALHERLLVAEETELEQVLAHVEAEKPDLLVVDSVQTIATTALDGRAGGVAQVHEITQSLTRWAKTHGLPTLLVGQSTRENSVAGPRALEHLVDTVLTFEGDRSSTLRLLRSVKNRFGPTDEVACFEHDEGGLVEISDPSGLFRKVRETPVPGSCLTVTIEGRRPLLAEIQALVVDAPGQHPRRAVTGLDLNRTTMLAAVCEKASGLALHARDIYVATVGGARINDPGSDLATCLAIVSSALDAPLWSDTVVLGEVTLSGDLRSAPGLAKRVAEASRLGFRRAVVPIEAGADVQRLSDQIGLQHVGHVADIVSAVLPRQGQGFHGLRSVDAPF